MTKTPKYVGATFAQIMGFIAQGTINIREGLTTIEDGSPVYKAMSALCELVNTGQVALTPLGEKVESEEKKRRNSMCV